MSVWYTPKKEDMDVDENMPEDLNIYLYDDYGGAVYAAVKIKDIKEVLEEYEKSLIENNK